MFRNRYHALPQLSWMRLIVLSFRPNRCFTIVRFDRLSKLLRHYTMYKFFESYDLIRKQVIYRCIQESYSQLAEIHLP